MVDKRCVPIFNVFIGNKRFPMIPVFSVSSVISVVKNLRFYRNRSFPPYALFFSAILPVAKSLCRFTPSLTRIVTCSSMCKSKVLSCTLPFSSSYQALWSRWGYVRGEKTF